MHIILFDGPHGMPLWDKAEERGFEKKPVWMYNIEHPEIVEALDREYVAEGAKILLANTFAANHLAVEQASPYETKDVIRRGMEITAKVCQGTDVIPSFAVGPVSEMLEPFGELSEEECREIFEEMISTAVAAGGKLVYLQTFMDLNMMEIAAKVALRYPIKIFCSMTFQTSGKTLFGNTVQDVIDRLEPLGIDAIGMNCELRPSQMYPIIREFSEKTKLPLVIKANASIMTSDGNELIDPVSYAKEMEPILPLVSYVGGCCGCDAKHIRELRKCIERFRI